MIASSLPPGIAEQVQDARREGSCTKNEFVREVLCCHAEKEEWLRTIRYERFCTCHTEQVR